MGRRRTLILFAVAVALGLVYFLLVRGGDDEVIDPLANRLITGLDVDDVHTIEIRRPDARLRFERAAGRWWMRAPYRERAEESPMTTLVTAVVEAEYQRRLEATATLAEYGLDPPAALVVFQDAVGDTLARVHLGTLTVDGEYLYARSGGSGDVYTIAPSVRRYAVLPVDSYRAQRVVEFAMADVIRYTVDTPERRFTWHRGPSGWFALADGDTIVGNPTEVESIPRILRGLRAEGFPDSTSVPRFVRELGAVTVTTREGETTLEVGGPIADGYAARVAGEARIVQVDSIVRKAFESTAFDLRARAILEFEPATTGRITLDSPELTATIVRAGGSWALPNPTLGGVDTERAQALVSHLRSLRFTEIFDDATPESLGLTEPNLSVTIVGDDGMVVDRMDCHQQTSDPSVVYVSSLSSGTSGRMSALDVLKLFEHFRAVRSP